MKNKKLFIWVLIIAMAILVSIAIIMPPALALSGAKNYYEKKEISVETLSTPEDVAADFYAWYLAYIGDPGSDSFRNPLVDRAYRESGFLSDRFVQELDDLLDEGISADPILLAQDIPNDFTVDPGSEVGTAIVHLQFGTETVRHLKVTMIQDLGTWKIDGIEQFQ